MHCCKDCAVQFDKQTAYFDHRRKEHARFSCLECGKVFGVRKKLIYHWRGCSQRRKNKTLKESGTVLSFSNYKTLPIVTAKELDSEFEIYMDRKFGRKGFFRNEKMCKFCCQTFAMASDFADHIREHYKSIPLDATGVKSKFDFMHFMGLKIRDANNTDSSDTETVNKLENKITECSVVIIGERCKICTQFSKCRTDLDQHMKVYHPPHNRDKITLVLRIGKEIISRISLKKRHIRRRSSKTSQKSNCKRLKIRSDEVYDTLKYSSKSVDKGKEIITVCPDAKCELNNNSYGAAQRCELIGEQKTAQSASSSKQKSTSHLRDGIDESYCNMTRWSQEAREKEIAESTNEEQNDFDSPGQRFKTNVEDYGFQSGRIYEDELLDSIELSEPWKDELNDSDVSWYSGTKLEEDNLRSDDDDCYCTGSIEPRLTPKMERSTWEQEHYDNLNEESEISFHESPPIYKYSCHSKYQADFGFSSDEESYGFQVKSEDNEETNNNEKDTNHNVNGSCVADFKGVIAIKDERKNLTINCVRSSIHEFQDKSFTYHELGNGKAAVTAVDKYPEALIKEEVMLEDCACFIGDVYPTLSHFNA